MLLLQEIIKLYDLKEYTFSPVEGHEGGRNEIIVCQKEGRNCAIIRISETNDRAEEEYLAETEFVHYLALNKAPVADVIPSVNGRLVEVLTEEGKPVYVSLFAYAKGMLICDNGYRYRECAPLSEYFYNTGKTLGIIHRLSKNYKAVHPRPDYFERFNAETIDKLIDDEYTPLKKAIVERLEQFELLPKSDETYGLVHFDFSDGNYHIDMNNGDITVFDFDNCIHCWYMYDLANLWIHGQGWCQFEEDRTKRKMFMDDYFRTIVEGYRSETTISDEQLEQLPLFIDMVLIENIVDEFECCLRAGEQVDAEDIQDEAKCLIHNIPFANFC